ncbi:MAG: phosphoribosylglycinamide synthetase C domain-containing protein [Candidatus Woesearchaeota archaeon]
MNGTEKKNFLFVSIDALISDIAWQVLKEGHNVKYFIEDPTQKDIADGFVPKTDNWEKEVDWADIIIFDDVLGQGKKAEKLKAQGKLVIGGSSYTDMLEDDRAFGQEELKKAGVPIIPYGDFTSFDDAVAFVQESPGKYVIKPSGEAQNIKRLLFVGEEEDGKDVIQVLEAYKRAWSKEVKVFQLQRKVTGVEVAVGAFFNGNEFINPINVNFEHKKLFPGNIGPSTGEMGCYDEKTEVLTRRGWKFFRQASKNDEFITLNKKGIIEYQKPTDIVVMDTHKELLIISNQTVDIAVTLNHNMYGIEANEYRKGKRSFGFVQAKNMPSQFVVPRTADWFGIEEKSFVLKSIGIGHRSGTKVVEKDSGNLQIKMDDWLKFLGFYIAEGSCSVGYKVSIACEKNKEQVRQMLAKMPFKFSHGGSEFYVYHKQLWSYLNKLGKADKKHVPSFVKDLSKRQISIFLDWYGFGDANLNNGFRIFYTSSKKLADDVQELLLKIGRVGIIKVRRRKGKVWIKDHWANINYPQYEVLERIKKTVSWLDKRDMEIVPYDKSVYCVTVPNHTLYVRRNGKPLFCGNTAMFWSMPNKIFNATLKKMEAKLAEEKYTGYIDINCIVNNNGIYPLEWTSRFGYPAISIQQEGILNPMGEFMLDLAKGNSPKLKTKSGFQIGIRIVVPPFPFNDNPTFDAYSREAAIIFKKPNLDGVHIEDVKKINGDWLVTGTAGVALIVVGTGQTMKQAQNQVYSRVNNILIPNMYYRTDIGNRWFEDSDRLHNWGYLREL